MAKREKRNRDFLIILLILLIFILIVNFRILKTEILKVEFSIGENLGISLGNELDFGRLLRGSSSEKILNIKNGYNFPIEAKISISRGIKEFIFAEEKIVIPANKETKIPVYIKIPENADFGNYNGEMKIEFLRKIL